MLRLIIELLFIYLLYKFIFELVLPVAKTTKHIKNKMNEMQKHMEEQQHYKAHDIKKAQQSPNPKQEKNEDYIDYEEVR